MLQQEPERAIEATDRVLPAAETGNLRPARRRHSHHEGHGPHAGSSDLREGLALITSGGDLGESLGVTKVATRALVNQSFALAWVSEREAYDNVAEGSAPWRRRMGHRGFEMNLVLNAVYSGIHVGEWDWASDRSRKHAGHGPRCDRSPCGPGRGASRSERLQGVPHQDVLTEMRAGKTAEAQVRQELDRAAGASTHARRWTTRGGRSAVRAPQAGDGRHRRPPVERPARRLAARPGGAVIRT